MDRFESPYHPLPDNFVWAKPDDLAEHCREFACELSRKGVKRSVEDRQTLALNCAALLLRIAETITGSPLDGRSLEIVCNGGGAPSRAFRDVIFQAKKSERRIYIERAAQLVLSNDTGAWLREPRGSRGSRLQEASESDAGFFIVLRELDDIYYQRVQDQSDIAAGRLPADFTSREGGEEEEPWHDRQRRIEAKSLHTMHNSRKKRRKEWWLDEHIEKQWGSLSKMNDCDGHSQSR